MTTIDNNPVMVAIRPEVRAEETGHDKPIPVARVFFMVDGVLNYEDIETFQDRPPLTVLSGELALFGGHWANQWTTLLGIENGKAWTFRRNVECGKVNWQFTTADARVKLKRLYPTIL